MLVHVYDIVARSAHAEPITPRYVRPMPRCYDILRLMRAARVMPRYDAARPRAPQKRERDIFRRYAER